jgi:cytidine deaminase
LADFEQGRLSVAVIDVSEGEDAAFFALAREFEALLARKGYGRAETIRDESNPRRYYAVRHWTDAASAQACHADPEAQALAVRLFGVARVTHAVNGVRRLDSARLPVDNDRPSMDAGRRSGFDRRVRDVGRAEGDRRIAARRVGPRRLRDQPGDIDLVAAARRAREHASAAFSRFKVGAALESADGTVFTGCNVENATYGLTVCAERVAMFKALSEGHRAFTRIAIVADTDAPTPPCGACRQILWEFGGNLEIQLANLHEAKGVHRLQDLLPLPFDARLL